MLMSWSDNVLPMAVSRKRNDVNDAEAVDSADFEQGSRALEWLVTGCLRMNDRKLGIDIVEQGLREFLASTIGLGRA